jgi:hypothetical protein
MEFVCLRGWDEFIEKNKWMEERAKNKIEEN